jgi:Ca-activated chloride channel family protein
VTFTLYEDKKDMNGNRRKLDTKYDAVSLFLLEPGSYVAVATRGNARVEAPLEVKPGELTEHTFILGAGNLKLSAVPAPGAEPFSKYSAVTFTVYEDKKDMNGNRKKVDTMYDAVSLFQLAAGRYVAVATRGEKHAEATVEVRPGELTEFTLVLSEAATAPDAGPETP